MNGLWHELLSAWRAAARRPSRMLVPVAILTPGLAVTLFMFSAVNAYLLRPLPFPDAERLVALELSSPESGESSLGVSIHDFADWRDRLTTVEGLAGFRVGTVNLSGDERPIRYEGAFVTSGALATIGVRPQLGRTFLPGEDAPGAPPVVVLGHSVWQSRYAGDPRIVGRVVRVNGRDTEVVGVMPPDFRFPYANDIWLPTTLDLSLPRGEGFGLAVVGRLREGVSVAAARDELVAVTAELARRYPGTNRTLVGVLRPYLEEMVDEGARTSILAMFGAVLLVLVIACANVANLILVRTEAAGRDLAIRSALGAGRARVVVRVMAECVVIATLSTAVAYGLAEWGGRRAIEVLRASPNAPPYWVEITTDWRSALFACAAALASTLLAGLLPAWRASRADLVQVLRASGRGFAGGGVGRISRWLVAAEVALSCVVLVAAGLMARSVVNLDRIDLGVDTSGVLTGRIGLFDSVYPDESSRARFFDQLEAELQASPEVEAAVVTSSLPGTLVTSRYLSLEGLGSATGDLPPLAHVVVASPGLFGLFGLAPLEGRLLSRADRADSAPVAVVNRLFVERLLDGVSPLGRRVRFASRGGPDPDARWITVVGVIGDVHHDQVADPKRPTIYLPLSQEAPRFATVALRPRRGEPSGLADTLRTAVQGLDPDLPVYWVRTLDEWIDQGRFISRFLATLFSAFAIVGLVLAAGGLYAVLASVVAERTAEIGVRRALGAQDRTIVGLLARRGGLQIAIGLGAGLGLSVVFARVLASLLYGVDPFDPVTFLVVAAALAATAAAASLLPAYRALAVQPADALRWE